MLARAILILSCLLCTHGFARAQAPATNTPDASKTTSTAPGVPVSAESVESAVPVHREALVPVAEPAPKRPLENDPLFTPAVVLIGTGGAALLASLFTGMGAHGIYTSLESDCKNNICSSDKEQRISSGKALAMVSTVLTGAGIAAAGVGTALLIIAAMHDDQAPKPNFGLAKLRLTPGPSPLGVGAAASF
ncbi:MAG TPA: hypothetical protein VFN67_04395 [Polyangiales bacterium]|nr:hypothetical protein [Polyangiales bacterium]